MLMCVLPSIVPLCVLPSIVPVLNKVTISNHCIPLINCKDLECAWLNDFSFNLRDVVKLSTLWMNCPLAIANFCVKFFLSWNKVFLINAIVVDILCNFDVIFF